MQADVPHGPAKLLHTPVRYLSVPAFSTTSRIDDRRCQVNAPPATGAGQRSNDSRTISQKLELTSGGIDSGLMPMLSIDDVSQ